MKFDRLQSSIELNANEKPSLYMTLCMVESLFKDVEDEAGADLSSTPMGDENLPTKLVWLIRKINKIYNEKSEEFERNRARLDAMMKEIGDKEAELSGLADLDGKIEDAKGREESLRKMISDLSVRRGEYEKILGECREEEAKIASLNTFDYDGAQAKLESLKKTGADLVSRRAELEGSIEKARTEAEEMTGRAAELEAESARVSALADERSKIKNQLEEQISALEERSRELDSQIESLTGEKDSLIRKSAFLSEEKDQLASQIESFRTESIAPLEEKLSAVGAELEGLRKEQADKTEEVVRLTKARDDAVLSLAMVDAGLTRITEAYETKKAELEKKKSFEEETVARIDSSQHEIDLLTGRIAELQDEAKKIEEESIPAARELCAKEEERKNELIQTSSSLSEEKKRLETENASLDERVSGLTRELDTLRSTHAVLTENYTETNNELAALNQKLEELRGKNDKKKAQMYRQQLNDEIAELNAASAECVRLEDELKEARIQLEKKQENVQTLRVQRTNAEEAGDKISALERELAPYALPEFKRRVGELRERLETLESIRASLTASLSVIRGAIDVPDVFTGSAKEVDDLADELARGVDSLQKTIVRCADSVRLEEK